jgi:hypothetical protein
MDRDTPVSSTPTAMVWMTRCRASRRNRGCGWVEGVLWRRGGAAGDGTASVRFGRTPACRITVRYDKTRGRGGASDKGEKVRPERGCGVPELSRNQRFAAAMSVASCDNIRRHGSDSSGGKEGRRRGEAGLYRGVLKEAVGARGVREVGIVGGFVSAGKTVKG